MIFFKVAHEHVVNFLWATSFKGPHQSNQCTTMAGGDSLKQLSREQTKIEAKVHQVAICSKFPETAEIEKTGTAWNSAFLSKTKWHIIFQKRGPKSRKHDHRRKCNASWNSSDELNTLTSIMFFTRTSLPTLEGRVAGFKSSGINVQSSSFLAILNLPNDIDSYSWWIH